MVIYPKQQHAHGKGGRTGFKTGSVQVPMFHSKDCKSVEFGLNDHKWAELGSRTSCFRVMGARVGV